jgi:DNA-binding winged helix-turn-helix (wHTH) protein
MATIASVVLEDAVQAIPTAELMSNPPPLEWTILCPRHERFTELELDNYQVALVPFRHDTDGTNGNPQRGRRINHLLLLPLTWKELVTRVHSEMGHSDSAEDKNTVQLGQVSIDFSSMEVSRADRPVSLTTLEFKILKFFISNPRRVISRDELLNEVWGYNNYPCTRTVDNHVLKLRQKLEVDPAHPIHFRTVHGTGYKFIA